MKKILVIFSIVFFMGMSAFAYNTEAQLQYNRGIDFYNMGKYDEAITCFRASVKADPSFIDAYYNLGSVLEYLEQYEPALAVFKQIIVRKPDDYEAVYKAAYLSYKLGQDDKAKTYLTLIPSYSAKYEDAKSLSRQLSVSHKSDIEMGALKIPETNNLYNSIPAPTGITSDNEGNVYVASFTTNSIYKITPDNKKVLFIKNAKIDGPIGIACDKNKNLYVANYNKNNVLKISQYGEITVLISNLKYPYYIYLTSNILYISAQGSDSVLKYILK